MVNSLKEKNHIEMPPIKSKQPTTMMMKNKVKFIHYNSNSMRLLTDCFMISLIKKSACIDRLIDALKLTITNRHESKMGLVSLFLTFSLFLRQVKLKKVRKINVEKKIETKMSSNELKQTHFTADKCKRCTHGEREIARVGKQRQKVN